MLKKFFFILPAILLLFTLTVVPTYANEISDYCDARSGDVINLETWYSGKCFQGGDGSPISGQYRGFSDIVFLDLLSKITEGIGDPTKLFGQNQEAGILPTLAMLTAKIATTPPASSTDYLSSIR